MAAEHQLPPALHTAFVGCAEDVAIEIKLAGAHFAGEQLRLGREAHHVAVAGMEDVADAVDPAQLGVGFKMRRFTVDRHQQARLHQVVEPAQLVAARVAGGMDERVVLRDDLDAAIDQQVLDVDDFALVAGDGP